LAEEMIQEVFLKVWRHGKGLAAIEHLENYLVTMARNRCYDQLRRRKLRLHSSLDEIDWKAEQHHETEETIELNETRRIIQAAVGKLPPQQRQVYYLCQTAGYKYEEAAREMNLSVATVQFYMKLALK